MSDHIAEGAYAAPRLTVLGGVHELTLWQLKTNGSTDGMAYIAAPGDTPQGLMNASS